MNNVSARNFGEAKKYLYGKIPVGQAAMFPGSLGLDRSKYLLELLGNPQDKIRVVHIAGTSGKGSTSFLISLILHALGFRVGLTLSPHLVDIRERVQINNRLIKERKFVRYLNDLLPIIKKVEESEFGSPTYFEILVALAYYFFWKEKVDYAVVETGLGGMYDASNVISSKEKLCVLTRIGLDHTQILGKRIADIAAQKAAIIQSRNEVVSVWQRESARKVIEKEVSRKKASLVYVKNGVNYKNIRLTRKRTSFNFGFNSFKIPNLELGMLGIHQAENCSLALTTVLTLARRDGFVLETKTVKKVLGEAYFPGRFEIRTLNKRMVILDGAHNPQKMASFVKGLKQLFPNKKFLFLLAFKKKKDYKGMLKYIVPVAQSIIITKFFVTDKDWIQISVEAEDIIKVLKSRNFNRYKVVEDPKEAFNLALSLDQKYPVIITGSLYLISEIYPLLRRY